MNTMVPGLRAGEPLNSARRPTGRRKGATGEQDLSLYRVGSLLAGGKRELCLVKQISTRTALIRAYCQLRPGDCVEIELKGHRPVAAAVASAGGTETTIRFDQAVDIQRLLRGGADGPPPRMPRVDVRATALIRQGASVTRAIVHNVSQGGISAESKGEFEVGTAATVTLPGIEPRAGVVRWTSRSGCGISFNNPVGLAMLVEWLQAHASTEA